MSNIELFGSDKVKNLITNTLNGSEDGELYIEDNVSPLHQPLFVCSICLDDSNENVKTLLCGHKFHKDCIEEWLNREESCPMCRIEFNL